MESNYKISINLIKQSAGSAKQSYFLLSPMFLSTRNGQGDIGLSFVINFYKYLVKPYMKQHDNTVHHSLGECSKVSFLHMIQMHSQKKLLNRFKAIDHRNVWNLTRVRC